jgi:AraC-like DNA-binding protein
LSVAEKAHREYYEATNSSFSTKSVYISARLKRRRSHTNSPPGSAYCALGLNDPSYDLCPAHQPSRRIARRALTDGYQYTDSERGDGVNSSQDPQISRLSFNTENVGEAVVDVWRESMAPFFHIEPKKNTRPEKDTYIDIYALGDLLCIEHQFNDSLFIRDRKRIASFDNDCIGFCLWLDGKTELDLAGKYVSAKQSAFLMDIGKPVIADAASSRCFSLAIPKPLLALHGLNPNALGGLSLESDDPRLAILCGTLRGVMQALPQIRQSQTESISHALSALIGGLFSPSEFGLSIPAVEAAVDNLVIDYIHKHLADPALDINMIARDLPFSRSSLYRQFTGEGGIAQFIREERLKRCYKAIASPSNLAVSLQRIAQSWGFSNSSHFSRLFKQYFNVSPNAVREQANAGDGVGAPLSSKTNEEQVQQAIKWFSRV